MDTEASPAISSPAERLNLIGGDLALDFVNTVGGLREPGNASEYLPTYSDLLRWSAHAELISEPRAAELAQYAAAHPTRANAVWREALELREALYRLFVAHAHGKEPPRADLALLNERIAAGASRRRLIRTENSYHWDWKASAHDLDGMLWQLTTAAADLLTSPRLALVRQCGGEDCTWLFVDTSKNHRRRWCDMRDCGNRAKARRHYERTHRAR